MCNSPKQSPINIDEDLTQVNVNLKELKFQGWDKISLENTFIHNTGKTGKNLHFVHDFDMFIEPRICLD